MRLLEAQKCRAWSAAGVPAQAEGLARAHAARLIVTYLAGRQLADGGKGEQPFRTRYTHEDILLLAETDE